jgi:RHS repeat-associated protein
VKDDNGLLYLRARYYNPIIGQFFSLDPLELGNRYQYVDGNTVNDGVGELSRRAQRCGHELQTMG